MIISCKNKHTQAQWKHQKARFQVCIFQILYIQYALLLKLEKWLVVVSGGKVLFPHLRVLATLSNLLLAFLLISQDTFLFTTQVPYLLLEEGKVCPCNSECLL